jgi:hypothetical protein
MADTKKTTAKDTAKDAPAETSAPAKAKAPKAGWQEDGTILTESGVVFDPRGYAPQPKADTAGHALSGADQRYVDELMLDGEPEKNRKARELKAQQQAATA